MVKIPTWAHGIHGPHGTKVGRGWADERTDGRMDGRAGWALDGQMGERASGCTGGRADGHACGQAAVRQTCWLLWLCMVVAVHGCGCEFCQSPLECSINQISNPIFQFTTADMLYVSGHRITFRNHPTDYNIMWND